MNRLFAIGFQFAGHWLLENERLQIDLQHFEDQRNILYAFSCNGEVKYIGQSTQTLRKRMAGYINPAPKSGTNIKNNKNIRELLVTGAAIDVFVLPDNGMMHYGPYHLNLAAGLEASLIEALKPEWNGRPKNLAPTASNPQHAVEEVTEYLPEAQLEAPETLETDEPEMPVTERPPVFTFGVRLEETYWNEGFFNARLVGSPHLGADGDKIEIFFGEETEPILGNINRRSNSNNTPRVFGGPDLRRRFQTLPRMAEMTVDVYTPTAIRIRPASGSDVR